MKKVATALALSLAVSTPAHAEMSVDMFLQRFTAMRAGKDPQASKILRNEMDRAARTFQERVRSGAIRDVCVQSGNTLEPEQLVNYFRSLPPPQRAMTNVTAGFYGAMKKRFHCW